MTVGPSSLESAPGVAYWRGAARLTLGSWRDMASRRGLAANISAGATVALVALPLNLALAIACGLPPAAGLITGAIAGVIGALFGGSRYQITGPEVALAPITLEIVSRFGFRGLLAVTFMAGLIQIALGLMRVGRLVNAVPVPVIGGFMAAVGLLVFDSQLPRLLGLPVEVGTVSQIRDVSIFGLIHAPTLLLGLVVVAALVIMPRLTGRLPAPLVGLGIAVTAVAAFGVAVPTVEAIQGAFPRPQLPLVAGLDLMALLPEAVALAMVASIDSLLCAISIDARVRGERTRTDQELVAQGLANIGSSFFGGMPVAAAVVRSVTAVEAGATSRLAPLVQSALLGGVLLALAPLVSYVPIVALAAILLVVGFRLINYVQLTEMWRLTRVEAAVFLATAAGILATDFVLGVGIGVALSLAFFARQQRALLGPRVQLETAGADKPVVRLAGPLFFGSQDCVEEALRSVRSSGELVVDVSAVSTVDVSGALALAKALTSLRESGTHAEVRGLGTRGDHAVLLWALESSGAAPARAAVPTTKRPPRAPSHAAPAPLTYRWVAAQSGARATLQPASVMNRKENHGTNG